MAVWQEKRLGDIFSLKYGKSSDKMIPGSEYKVFSSSGLFGLSNSKLADKGIIVGRKGSVGSVFFSRNPFYCIDTTFYIDNTNNENMLFIYYYLKNMKLNLYNSDAAVPGLNKHHLERCYCIIPDLVTQEKIADILSTYDDLIENNNRRIEILEQMAQEIYKEWFVRFRFPGHEKVKFVSSKLGKLPQTFNVVNAETVFEFYIGGGWGNENISENFPIEANVIRGTDIPNIRKYDISTCPVRYHKISNYKSRQLVSGDIVMEISGGTADQPVGRCALITQELIDRFKNGNVICASFCKLIRLNKNLISPYFCYYWLQYLYDTRIIDRFQLQSTGIINFKFEAFLKKGLIMLPPMDIMHQFENYVKYIVQEINMLASQNQNLIKQRDLLLPRLISGKLEV